MEGTATAAAVPGKGPNPDYKEVSGLAKKGYLYIQSIFGCYIVQHIKFKWLIIVNLITLSEIDVSF